MTPITTPKLAVKYAHSVATPMGLLLGLTIHLDKHLRPLPLGVGRDGASASVIEVVCRDGSCIPSTELIEDVTLIKTLWSKQGKELTDVIVIGDDGFYSFSEERTFRK